MSRVHRPPPPKLIALSLWAEQRFNPPPANRTLLLWVKECRIIPPPVKIGRAYYVTQDAQHINEVNAAPRLIDRVQNS